MMIVEQMLNNAPKPLLHIADVSGSALLFDVPPITTETCLNCQHRERHQCGGSIIQYCGIRKSNRTYKGQLKIKCKTPACSSFKKMENG